MKENLTGLVKILGITVLMLILWALLAYYVPEKFLKASNIQNLLDRTALYGILGIGVAFVIISSGIDLSIGSLVCLAACLLATLLHVTHHPLEAIEVWEFGKDSKTMTISASDESLEVDQWLFLESKREKKLFQIEKVELAVSDEEHGTVSQLTMTQGPRREPKREGDNPAGTISPVYEIESVDGETKLTLKSTALNGRLEAKDKIRLVHPTKGKTEKVVLSVEQSSDGKLTIELDNKHKGLDTGYFVVPQKRWVPMSISTAIFTILGAGLVIGLIHGLLITRLNQRPFIITLCGLLVYRGLARWVTKDQPYGFADYTDEFGWIESGRWVLWESVDKSGEAVSFGLPFTVFFLAALTVVAIVILNYTVWGRHLLAVGRNEEAARFSGINTKRVTLSAYVICAVLTAIGGILFAIDAGSVTPSSFGNFFELYAIAAAVLGGCSLRGGEGSIIGVVVGTALMQTLNNSIVLLGIPGELEFTIIGTVILIGVVSDEVVRRIAGKFRKVDTSS